MLRIAAFKGCDRFDPDLWAMKSKVFRWLDSRVMADD